MTTPNEYDPMTEDEYLAGIMAGTDARQRRHSPYKGLMFQDDNGLIFNDDCRRVAETLYTEWGAEFDFIFADPPFNIGHGYDIYIDRLEDKSFVDFIVDCIYGCIKVLKPGGVFAFHCPDAMVKLAMQTFDTFAMTRIGWVIQHYRFGQCTRSNWINSKCHCLIFRRDFPGDLWGKTYEPRQHIWNPDDVLVESDRSAKYGDDRTLDSATPGFRVPLDVWEFARIQGNNKERVAGNPNQLPEMYLARLLRAYTNRGSFVFDPFGGTFTTFAVARALGRYAVSCDISEAYCINGSKRKVVRNV